MPNDYTMEKEGEGRYAVLLNDRSRAGLVMGGNGRWLGETADGNPMGSWMSRKAAAQAVADDASDPIWKTMRLIAHKANLPRAERQSDLRHDRLTLRAMRGKSDFLWILTPEGTHIAALDPPLRDDDMLRRIDPLARIDPQMPDAQAWLIRAKSWTGGVTRVRKPQLLRMLQLL